MRLCTFRMCLFWSCAVVMLFVLFAFANLYNVANRTLYPADNLPLKSKISEPLGTGQTGLMWFVQVTDTHLSIFRDQERISELSNFCTWVLEVVKPPVIVASGDLTDAKTSDHLGSRQWIQEWQHYQGVVENCLAGSSVKWLDIRGNHDTFDVADDESKNNYFRKFSVQGPVNSRSYATKVEFNNRTYGFVGIDATLVPGPKRPFNFFGAFSKQQFDEIQTMVDRIKSETDSHFVFGHYPTSCILSPSPGIRHILRDSMAYLCGHLHTLAGIVPEMYARQSDGFFELELGDWKDNRRFRILALDEGQLAFTDYTYNSPHEEAAIVVTNPIDVRFSMAPNSIDAMKTSTHIRILVFSKSTIESVDILIDENKKFQGQRVSLNQPLFIAEWNASAFNDGQVHSLRVDVSLADGTLQYHAIQFGLESKDVFVQRGQVHHDFSFMARLVLLTNLMPLTQATFAVLMLLAILPLVFLRIRHQLTLSGKFARPRRPAVRWWHFRFWTHKLMRRFWLISAIDGLFFPLIIAPLYLMVGPWAIGYFLEESFGILFAWGFHVHGTLLHGDTTSFYAVFFIAPYLYLFNFGVAGIVQRRFDNDGLSVPENFCTYLASHAWFVILICFQLLHCIDSYLCYGVFATIGVCGLTRVVYFTWICNKALNLSYQDFHELRKVWPKSQ